jgi:predicted peptidase
MIDPGLLEPRTYRNASGETLPYRILVPKAYDRARQYPLLVVLHGAGERGDDNQSQLLNPEVLMLISDEVQAGQPAFFVAPQCPAERFWVDVSWNSPTAEKHPPLPSDPLRLAIELVDGLKTEFTIDARRQYLTGLSMGGFGAVDWCFRRPSDVAAAAVVCGGGDDIRAAELAGIPFWFFHGTDDDVVPVEYSRRLVAAIRAAGGQARYTEYPGVGHHSWVPAYAEPELPRWLFGQHR